MSSTEQVRETREVWEKARAVKQAAALQVRVAKQELWNVKQELAHAGRSVDVWQKLMLMKEEAYRLANRAERLAKQKFEQAQEVGCYSKVIEKETVD